MGDQTTEARAAFRMEAGRGKYGDYEIEEYIGPDPEDTTFIASITVRGKRHELDERHSLGQLLDRLDARLALLDRWEDENGTIPDTTADVWECECGDVVQVDDGHECYYVLGDAADAARLEDDHR